MTDTKRPPAFIFDIDGTLAMRNGRDPYDWDLAGTDLPNQPVIDVAQALDHAGHRLLYVSGRPEDIRTTTKLWLHEHVGVEAPLLMRPSRDFRPDVEIKREIYLNEIRPRYDVVAVFDDRTRIVELWRDELGLVCLQVAPGNF